MNWLDRLASGTPLVWPEQPLPGSGRALALAPHPDDPEAVAVTLHLLAQGGWEVSFAVLTSAWSGVQDSFVGPSREAKGRVREQEARAAAALFGLPEERLTFLRLRENDAGEVVPDEGNRGGLFAFLDRVSPDLVLLPWRDDTNRTHQRTYQWLAEWAPGAGHRVIALGIRDPKTTGFRADLRVTFGEEAAAWKAALLECHSSQSARNMATRGYTLADRILAVNRAEPGEVGPYVERFRVECWGGRREA